MSRNSNGEGTIYRAHPYWQADVKLDGEGTIYKKQGYWRADVELSSGELVKVRKKTETECAAEARRLVKQGGELVELVEIRTKKTKKECQEEIARHLEDGGELVAGPAQITAERKPWIGKIDVIERNEDGTTRKVRRKIRGESQTEVKKAIRVLRRAKEAGEVQPARSATLAMLIANWRETLDGQELRQASLVQLNWALDAIGRHLGDVRLERLDTGQCDDAMRAATRGKSKRSAQIIVRALKRLLDYGIETGKIVRNPAAGLQAKNYGDKPPRGRAKKEKAWTEEECERLWAECERLRAEASEHRIQALVLVGLCTGARVGELTALQWDCVDLDNGEIDIRRSREGATIVDDVKTASSARIIPIPPEAVEILRAQKKKLGEAQLAAAGPSALVFPNATGRVYDRKTEYKEIKALCRAAGVRELGGRAMRHTYATAQAHDGMPVAQLQAQLGHASPSTTLQFYVSARPVNREHMRAVGAPRPAERAAT
jgi:integrase